LTQLALNAARQLLVGLRVLGHTHRFDVLVHLHRDHFVEVTGPPAAHDVDADELRARHHRRGARDGVAERK